MKPRKKIVTAEDVMSSLYFLHVDQPGEGLVVNHPPMKSEAAVEGSPIGQSGEHKGISRKPLPSWSETSPINAPARSDAENRLSWRSTTSSATATVNRSNEALGSGPVDNMRATKRKPVNGGVGDSHGERRGSLIHSLPSGSQSSGHPVSMVTSNGRFEESGPPVPPRHYLYPSEPISPHHLHLHHGIEATNGEGNQPGRRSHRTADGNRNVSITVIRRDPTSGAQWNVGKIIIPTSWPSATTPLSSSLDGDRPSLSLSKATMNDPLIQIEITNPGYNKFLDSHKAVVSPSSYGHGHGHDHGQRLSQPTNVVGNIPKEDTVFRRYISVGAVRLSSSSSLSSSLSPWFSGISRQRQNISKNSTTAGGGGGGGGGVLNNHEGGRRWSVMNVVDQCRNRQRQLLSSLSSSLPPYTFLGPWDDLCVFSVGASGRNLKVC